MNWQNVYNGLKSLAALGGLMAFASFSYTYYKDVAAREVAAARSWQAIEVFSLALQSGEKGVTLDELVTGVQGALIDGRYFETIDPNIATEAQVLRGIVELASKNSIIMGTDRRYRVPLQFAGMVDQDLQFSMLRDYQNKILNEVSDHPQKFSSEDLRNMLRNDGAKEIDIQRAVMPLLMSGPWGPPMLIPSDVPSNTQDIPPYMLKLEMMK